MHITNMLILTSLHVLFVLFSNLFFLFLSSLSLGDGEVVEVTGNWGVSKVSDIFWSVHTFPLFMRREEKYQNKIKNKGLLESEWLKKNLNCFKNCLAVGNMQLYSYQVGPLRSKLKLMLLKKNCIFNKKYQQQWK